MIWTAWRIGAVAGLGALATFLLTFLIVRWLFKGEYLP